MVHQKLSQLREAFVAKHYQDYAWLEGGSNNKRSIILLHGVTGGKDDMLPLAVEYNKLGYRTYCLDLPGHGSSLWHGQTTFKGLAQWLDGFIRHIGAPDILLANSFSSAIVYAYVQLGLLPSKTHVILACPTPDTSWLSRGLYKTMSALPLETGWYIYTTKLANFIRTSTLAKRAQVKSIRWLSESERRKRRSVHPHAGVELSTLLFADNPYDGPKLSEAVQERMTVIIGTRDNVVTKGVARKIQQLLPHARHIFAQRAGHILHFEAVSDMVAHTPQGTLQ